MRIYVLSIFVLAAGCESAPRLIPVEPRDPPPPMPSPASPPLRTLALAPEVGCPRDDASLPGHPAPEPILLERILEHEWCFYTPEGIRKLVFAASGGLTTIEHDEREHPRATRPTCWALSGEEIAIRRVEGAWDVWPVALYDRSRGGHPTLAFRNESHVPCRPRPPKDLER